MPTGGSEWNVSIAPGMLAAMAFWILAVALLTWGTFVADVALQSWGIASVGAAAVAQIRYYFCRQNRLFRRAFELGQDSAGVSTAERVRPLR